MPAFIVALAALGVRLTTRPAAVDALSVVVAVLVPSMLVAIATGRARAAFVAPAAVAWALVLVPQPPSDFWPNGATDLGLSDRLGGLLALPLALGFWSVTRPRAVVLATVAVGGPHPARAWVFAFGLLVLQAAIEARRRGVRR